MTSTQNLNLNPTVPQIIGTTIHDEQVVVHRASLGRFRIVIACVTVADVDGNRYHATQQAAADAALAFVPSHRRA